MDDPTFKQKNTVVVYTKNYPWTEILKRGSIWLGVIHKFCARPNARLDAASRADEAAL